MKYLLACLTVIVYMNNGHVYTYKNAQSVCDNHENGGPFDAGRPATIIYVSKDQSYACNPNQDVVASFPLNSVERWEIK